MSIVAESELPPTLACTYCEFLTTRIEYLQNHENQHEMSKEGGRFACTRGCTDAVYPSKALLLRHLAVVHKEQISGTGDATAKANGERAEEILAHLF